MDDDDDRNDGDDNDGNDNGNENKAVGISEKFHVKGT
jgi:hypothetical protein